MPLIILGIIAVVGAGLMIYYQVGPTLKNRVRTPRDASYPSRSGEQNTFGGYIDLKQDTDFEVVSKDGDEGISYGKSQDGKVLYIFNAGKTELRSLNEDEEEKEEAEETEVTDDTEEKEEE